MSVDEIWTRLEPLSHDTSLQTTDAEDAVGVWDACAWAMELVDATTSSDGSRAQAAYPRLTELAAAHEWFRPVSEQIVADSKLGDIASSQQFIQANECKAGFPG
jgi:hypothetical protein